MAQANATYITENLPKRLPRGVREKIETAAAFHQQAIETSQRAFEALVAVLDHADGDTDLEPSLGWPKCGKYGTALVTLDAEDQCEGEAEQCEDEGADEHYLREGAL